MSVLESLLAADRIVLAGLAAYDEACQRLTASAVLEMRANMQKLGHSEDEIEAVEQSHRERIREGRGKLHVELWKRALVHVSAD